MIGNEVITILIGTGATLSMLNHTTFKQPFPQSTEKIQMVGVSNKPFIGTYLQNHQSTPRTVCK